LANDALLLGAIVFLLMVACFYSHTAKCFGISVEKLTKRSLHLKGNMTKTRFPSGSRLFVTACCLCDACQSF